MADNGYISAALIFFMVLWFFFMIKNTSTVTVKKDNQVKADTVKEIDSSEKKSSLFSLNMFSCYILYFCTCYAYYLMLHGFQNS